MKPIAKIGATGVVVLAALGVIAYKYFDYVKYPWTRDGLVRAQVVQIVPRISGPLVRVPIHNNQLVERGDLLFEVDPRTFQAALDLARAQRDNMRDIIQSLADQVAGMRGNLAQYEAAVRQATFEEEGYEASVTDARIQFERMKELVPKGFATEAEYDNKFAAYQMALAQLDGGRSHVNEAIAERARAKDDLARAIADLGTPGEDNPRLRRAEADLETAQLDLDFTKVRAPTDGYITNLQLGVGDSAVANQPIVAIIEAKSFYVEAFFRETFVGDIQDGDRAIVTLMSYPDTPLEGRVESMGWGIAQQNGSTGFQLLPSVSPTFEWIRLAQRIPIIVHIEKVPDNVRLRGGTTASVMIMTGTSTGGGPVPPVPLVLQ